MSPPTEQPQPSARGTIIQSVRVLPRRSRLLAIATTTVLLAGASVASAGTYPMHQCAPGTPALAPGWSVFGYATQASTVLSNSCSPAGAIGDYVFSNGQAGAVTENGSNGSQVGIALNVPSSAPDVTIASIAAEVLASPVTGDDAFLGFASAGQGLAGGVELPDGADGYNAAESWTLPQGARDFQAYVNCSTDHSSTTCYFSNATSVPALTDITLTLIDNTPPSLPSVSGGLAAAAASAGTLTGSQPLNFTASDTGSGVRAATLTLTPQGGGGAYTHTFDLSAACTYDSWNACPLTDSVGGYSLSTAALKDGIYSVDLAVSDAAGNETSEALGSFTSHNAPTATTPPSILHPENATAGPTLTAQPGTWSAPSEAGTVSYSYQWEACNPEGNDCQAITGATAPTYTPAAAEAGHTLRVLVSAGNNDGSASLVSPTTTAGTQPSSTPPAQGALGALPGPANTTPSIQNVNSTTAKLALDSPVRITRPYNASAITISGTLTSTRGGPIRDATLDILQTTSGQATPETSGHATTTTNGTFAARIPKGPSRTITIDYPPSDDTGGQLQQASVSETVSADPQLHITPPQTDPTGAITITGTVAGPIPRGGVLVELLVHYRGQWVPFRTPRTSPTGHFKTIYQFQGASGQFPFRALVPAGQAGFPYTRGYSNTITVHSG